MFWLVLGFPLLLLAMAMLESDAVTLLAGCFLLVMLIKDGDWNTAAVVFVLLVLFLWGASAKKSQYERK